MLVAASVARQGRASELPAVAVELADRALTLGAERGSALAWLARHRPGRWLLAGLERIVLPGLAAHHCARKAWLWRRLQTHHASQRQMLWLGVGFDGLGRALPPGGARVIETDHPNTLRERRVLLPDGEMHALELPGQLHELVRMCFTAPTTIVCEGVLMYLPKRVVLRTLRTLAAMPSPPRLIFTAPEPEQHGARGFRRSAPWVRRWLERQGEAFRWRCEPGRLRSLLGAAGYTVVDDWDGEGFGEYAIDARPDAIIEA
jgi:O-methyltransferase involved in polyketide biosynthesis